MSSNPPLLQRGWRVLARHLLLRHGVPATLAEIRMTGFRPRPSMMLGSPGAKMFRSDELKAEQIDYLYSELVALAG